MERPEPRVRLCQIERGGGKLVAEGDVRAVAPLMKVLDWLNRRKRSPGPFPLAVYFSPLNAPQQMAAASPRASRCAKPFGLILSQ